MKIGGQKLPLKSNDIMVGQDITAKRRRDVQAISRKTERAGDRAMKVSNMCMSKKEKTRVIQGAIIPAATSCTMWDIPTNKATSRLRAQTLNAVWGKGRRLRCLEIVLGVLNDPTKTDPLGATVFKRISDARRLMRKSQARLHYAMHTYEVTNDDDHRDNIHCKHQGPIAGLRQAAVLLGGSLSTDEDGFYINFQGDFPPLHINKGKESSWKKEAKRAVVRATTMQPNMRTKDHEEDEDDEEAEENKKTTKAEGTPADTNDPSQPKLQKRKRQQERPSWNRELRCLLRNEYPHSQQGRKCPQKT